MNATQRAQEKIEAVSALLRWMAKSGTSAEVVAKRLGVTDSTIYNWLNGDTLPTGKGLESLKRLVRS